MKLRGLLLALALLLAACASDGGGSDAARAVEAYLTAKAAGDEAAVARLLCSAMEADLFREVHSFAAVETRIEGLACQREGDTDVVRCDGQIIAVYGGEDTVFPLTAYRVIQEGGEWKWCGEAG